MSAALVGLATMALASLLLATGPVDAHGAATRPGSRTYLCRVDGTHSTGDIHPNNPACAQAIAIGGKQPLWDWFGVLRSDGAGRTSGYIPDGQLCSGGEPKYAGYDVARNDWPYTRLTAGSELTVRYNAWAPHPGRFSLYVTKDGYDPSQPLRWDDLEDEPFSTYDQSNPNGRDEANGTSDYQWRVQLPQKSGAHIIYAVWARSDSNETFYGCSDVRFDGGNGEVMGVGTGSGRVTTPPSPSTAPPTNPPPTGAAPSTTVAPTVPPSTVAPSTMPPSSTGPGQAAPAPSNPADPGSRSALAGTAATTPGQPTTEGDLGPEPESASATVILTDAQRPATRSSDQEIADAGSTEVERTLEPVVPPLPSVERSGGFWPLAVAGVGGGLIGGALMVGIAFVLVGRGLLPSGQP